MSALKWVAEPRRQAILRLVWRQERSAGDIARQFDISFAAISQHLAKLRAAGLVQRRREGQHIFYRANLAALGPLASALEAMWADRLTVLKTLAEAEEKRLAGRDGAPSGLPPGPRSADTGSSAPEPS